LVTPMRVRHMGVSAVWGGTSTRWGGALIPFTAHDLGARPYIGLPSFPVSPDAVGPYIGELERIFDVDPGSYEEEFVRQVGAVREVPVGDPDFKIRFAKWPPFKNRNVANLFKGVLESKSALDVWINATATKFSFDRERGRIVSVTARNEIGGDITVTTDQLIICAGAIEATRLLLLFDLAYEKRIFGGCAALGKYFYDHISVPMAKIAPKQVKKLNRLAGFRFVGSTMRSLRFELSTPLQEIEKVGSAFAHISFRTKGPTGFDRMRELMRTQQRLGRFPIGLLWGTLRDLPFVARAAIWKLAYHQLLWPEPAVYELHVVAEQTPRAENCISLATETDSFGSPRAAIMWKITEDDWRTFSVFRTKFDRFWKRRELDRIGNLYWTSTEQCGIADAAVKADVYHPGGTTRMGMDSRSAVVDANLRTFGVKNLWISSTSTFPTGGGANPTLTLMLFTLRLAEHLRKNYGRSS
jgi:choline dehydrogenase-like flavoprotein